MGTNYYRIPTHLEMEARKAKLIKDIADLDISPSCIESEFRYRKSEDSWDTESVWDRFIQGTRVHLGKRSAGWRFCWNFHNNRYYQDRASLLAFIRSGRVVDEYGESWDTEQFIEMALEWGEPDGLVADAEYFNTTNHYSWMSNPEDYYDREVDGLRVSASTEFS
jgi:hypothetical protein